jgi:hypothetical protein
MDKRSVTKKKLIWYILFLSVEKIYSVYLNIALTRK